MWIVKAREIADEDGKPTGRWRMTAKSDEGPWPPTGDTSHDHATAAEAEACDACEEYVARVSGMMSRKEIAEINEEHDRKEYERLKAKYEPNSSSQP